MKLFNRGFLEQITQRPLQVTLYLGFFSGLPLALSGSTLQAWFTVAGINIVAIGFLSLVGQPYIYKFLWAPLLDRYILPGGRRRGWILLMQLALVITIASMAFLNPAQQGRWLVFLALLLALGSATQDIAIDAYRTDLLKPQQRGLGAAMVTCGYRIAMLVSGALALVIAAKWGWRFTYILMAILMSLGIIITWWVAPEPIYKALPPTSLRAAIWEPFREFWSRDGKITLLLFIVFYKIGDAFALTLSTTFLIRGVGFSLVQIGIAYKTVGMIAALLGSLVGGILMLRMRLYRSLWYFGILQGVANLMFLWLALVGKSLALLVGTVFAESFFSSLSTVALVAFLMALCNHRYTATQFALFSALSAVGRVVVGPIAGIAVEHSGWVSFYFWTFWAAAPGLVLLWWLRDKVQAHEEGAKLPATGILN